MGKGEFKNKEGRCCAVAMTPTFKAQFARVLAGCRAVVIDNHVTSVILMTVREDIAGVRSIQSSDTGTH